MAITVYMPKGYRDERDYILRVILGELLGLEYQVDSWDREVTCISFSNNSNIILADTFFNKSKGKWLDKSSLPQQPLKVWDASILGDNVNLIHKNIPVIYGEDPDDNLFFNINNNTIKLGLDIFGSAFFMLTRYEEVVNKVRDNHNRFPAIESIAFQEGFLHRPIVNEYLEILWACIKRVCQPIRRKKREFRNLLSHDVDAPYDFALHESKTIVKRIAGDIIRRKSIRGLYKTITNSYAIKRYGIKADPYNTFDYIMDVSEQYNITSAFYFIPKHSAGKIDGDYTLDDYSIRILLKNIHKRGHEIGLHASYNSYRDPVQTANELRKLKKTCIEENIKQEIWGSRQHYLRWETPVTFSNCEKAGLEYDTTLTYAAYPGFRCGICYEYQVYDVEKGRTLNLRERPLIVMEGSVLNKSYMGLDIDESYNVFKGLKDSCRMYSGDYTLLWHNNSLVEKSYRELYEAVIAC